MKKYSLLIVLILTMRWEAVYAQGNSCTAPLNIATVDSAFSHYNLAFSSGNPDFWISFIPAGGSVLLKVDTLLTQAADLDSIFLYAYNGNCTTLQLIKCRPASLGGLFANSLDPITYFLKFTRSNCLDSVCEAFSIDIASPDLKSIWICNP